MKKILIIVLVMGLVGAAVAAYLYNKPAATTISGAADYEVAASKLFAEFEENETAANSKYLNKSVAVKGKIASITPGEKGSATLTLETDNPMFGISCEIAEPGATTGLKPGETITVK